MDEESKGLLLVAVTISMIMVIIVIFAIMTKKYTIRVEKEEIILN